MILYEGMKTFIVSIDYILDKREHYGVCDYCYIVRSINDLTNTLSDWKVCKWFMLDCLDESQSWIL